ncbi:hypothetical protein N0U25_09565 [Pseudomonas sivasensis]|uniref:DUF6957 family protein n=1 Tax=Pseudomonas sivasensis TaxID=1880678 RepID=UPI0021A99435|nr:hypothetical protein [Pseudomonas sivasensis]MCT4498037.1 hypothetical protein [Pseudomonas sivasensis]
MDIVKTAPYMAITGGKQVWVAMKKSNVTDTELLGDLFYGAAHIVGGSRLADDELISVASDTFKERHFCVVRHWMLLDVLPPPSIEQDIKAQGLETTILFAQLMVFDSQNKHRPGESVLSDYQRDLDGCIFESKDTLYILAGRGARKHVSVPAVAALHEYLLGLVK